MGSRFVKERQKVLVIGLDGATFDLIDPWTREGKLPTLAGCLGSGVRALLRSTPLSNSAQAWSSFITGKNPGKHGIFDFFEPLPDSYGVRFINASFRKGKSLWRILGEAGKRVGVINVPITYPAEAVNGFMIAGLDAPGLDKHAMYPPELLQEVRKKLGEYVLEAGVWGFMRKGRPDLALQGLLDAIEMRAATARYLMENHAWDFFMVVFTETDKVQHHFWKYIDPARAGRIPASQRVYAQAIFQVYDKIDGAIRQLCEAVPADTSVFILSDHGAGPSSNKTMFINHWLQHEGFLSYRQSSLMGGGWERLLQTTLRRSDAFVKKVLSRQAKEKLVRLFPGVRNKVDSLLLLAGIDWSRTVAYSRENHPTISINLKGREPQGIVLPGREYDETRRAIVDRLLQVRCPETGEPIVEEVAYAEKVYHGPDVFRAPDIIFRWKDHAYVHRPSRPDRCNGFLEVLPDAELERAEMSDRPSGIHRALGVFIAKGPWVKKGQEIRPVDFVDVTPTILHLLGVPIPDDMDGQVLTDIFEDGFVREHTVRYSGASWGQKADEALSVFDADEEQVIRARLQGLGYID